VKKLFKIISTVFVFLATAAIALNLLFSAVLHVAAKQNSEIHQKANQKKMLYAVKYLHNNNLIAKDNFHFVRFFHHINFPRFFSKITPNRTIAYCAITKTSDIPIQHCCLLI